MNQRRSILGIAMSLGAAGLIALAGSDGSVRLGGIPLFALCGVVAFAVHWIAFVPAYLYRTERYFDLTGTIAYLSVVACAWSGNPGHDHRSVLIGVLIVIWTLRLGSFLFRRIQRAGKDDRFDRLKHDPLAFFMTWTLSGLWVYLTAAAALAAMTVVESKPLGAFAVVGALIWLAGFGIEAIADAQKSRFRSRPENKDRFISEGVWAWSRHPNYFGEIVLWAGIALIAAPSLSGWQYATLISPVFVWLLLTQVSGVPLLEAKSDKKWGHDPAYQDYKRNTPKLVPRPPRRPAS